MVGATWGAASRLCYNRGCTRPTGRAIREAARLTCLVSRTFHVLFGELRKSRFSEDPHSIPHSQRRTPKQPDLQAEAPRRPVFRHCGLRRYGGAAGGQRSSFAAQLHSAGASRAGEDSSDSMLVTLLDDYLPFIEGSEIRDNPYAPGKYGRERIADMGEDTPIDYLTPENATWKTCNAGCDDRRHDRRYRSHQSGAQGPQHLG